MRDVLGPAIAAQQRQNTEQQHRRNAETQKRGGTVKWFSPAKGFGFITPDGISELDVFLHARALEDADIDPASVKSGDKFMYVVTQDRGGPVQASAITRID
jgi:cold shock protein